MSAYLAPIKSAAAYYGLNPAAPGAVLPADGPLAFLSGLTDTYNGSAALGPRGVRYYSTVFQQADRANAQGRTLVGMIGPLPVCMPIASPTALDASPY